MDFEPDGMDPVVSQDARARVDELTRSIQENPGSPWDSSYPEADAPVVAEVDVDATALVSVEPEVRETDAGETVGLDEVLFQYREAILDLAYRVYELERRPQFAASLRTKRTGH